MRATYRGTDKTDSSDIPATRRSFEMEAMYPVRLDDEKQIAVRGLRNGTAAHAPPGQASAAASAHVLARAQDRRSDAAQLVHGTVQIPGLVSANDMTLVDHLWRTWSPRFELDGLGGARCPRAFSRVCRRHSATTKRSCGRRERIEKLAGVLSTPLLHLRAQTTGASWRQRTTTRASSSTGSCRSSRASGTFLHLEAPSEIAHRILDWLVYPFIRLKVQRAWSTPFDATAGTRLINTGRIATAPSQPGRKVSAPPCQLVDVRVIDRRLREELSAGREDWAEIRRLSDRGDVDQGKSSGDRGARRTQ
jgi:hypothetical protein